jgi:hypothetical protein
MSVVSIFFESAIRQAGSEKRWASRAEIVSDDLPILHAIEVQPLPILRRKENLACVRIFYFGSGRKTDDEDVTAIWRERTGN